MRKLKNSIIAFVFIVAQLLLVVPAFAYTYDTVEASLTLNTSEEMTLLVEGEDMEPETHLVNGSKTIAFSFDEPGSHEYHVSQVIPSTKQSDVKYDTAKWNIYITVCDDGEGKLVCFVAANNGITDEKFESVSFVNVYPEPEEESTPEKLPTGDTFNMQMHLIIFGVAVLSVIFLCIVLGAKKKKEEEDA